MEGLKAPVFYPATPLPGGGIPPRNCDNAVVSDHSIDRVTEMEIKTTHQVKCAIKVYFSVF